MTGRPVIGVILAVLVEIHQLVKIRWDFEDDAYARAWQLTTIAISLTAVLIYLDGSIYQTTPKLLTWLPLLLLPMQFVQSFGMNRSIPLITFSFIAKHRRRRNLRLGLQEEAIHINFGNVYFVACLIASTVGAGSSTWLFLPGVIMLTGWMILSASRNRPASLVVALTLAGGLALTGQYGLEELDNWLGNRGPTRASFDPNISSTMIGRAGTIQQSPDILWRLRPAEGTPPPRLLRTAVYNTYQSNSWLAEPLDARKFDDLDVGTYQGELGYSLEQYPDTADQLDSVRDELPRFKMRGSALADTPLPLPGDGSGLLEFQLDGVEHNALGSVLVSPKQPVIEGRVLWKGNTRTETVPYPSEDLFVPHLERETLKAVIKELNLDEHPALQDKLNIIHSWFVNEFKYTRTLEIQTGGQVAKRPTAITQFLTTIRAGHCEYFAAATVLLLREAKIPARYATGYSVFERNPKLGEYVIRGTHGHAWCRVWDEENQRWLDFDTTPPSWTAIVPQLNPWMQQFNDSLKRFREDFFLWRNEPNNRLGASLVMWAIALGVIGFVFKRLWKSKRRLEAEKKSNGYAGTIQQTPLNELEKHAEKHLAPRPPGKPFGIWLSDLRHKIPDAGVLDEAVEIHQRLRFDPAPRPESDEARLAELAKQLEFTLKQH